jgi:hypothetical protein
MTAPAPPQPMQPLFHLLGGVPYGILGLVGLVVQLVEEFVSFLRVHWLPPYACQRSVRRSEASQSMAIIALRVLLRNSKRYDLFSVYRPTLYFTPSRGHGCAASRDSPGVRLAPLARAVW